MRFRCGCSGLVSPVAAGPFGAWVMRREVACVVGTRLLITCSCSEQLRRLLLCLMRGLAAVICVGESRCFRWNRFVDRRSPLPVHTTTAFPRGCFRSKRVVERRSALPVHTTTAVSTRVAALHTVGTRPCGRARYQEKFTRIHCSYGTAEP